MHSTLKTLIFVLCLSLASAEIPSFKDFSRNAELDLMRFITQSRDVSGNPQQSVDCFSYYMPLMTACTEEYETTYKGCLDDADENRIGVDKATQSDRDDLETRAKSSCDAMAGCIRFDNSLNYFGCVADEGSRSTSDMYVISADANQHLTVINEKHRLIQNDENSCKNACYNTYVEDYSQMVTELKKCTQGITQVPQPEPETPKSTTETSQPEADETEHKNLMDTNENELPEEDLFDLKQFPKALQNLRKHLIRY